VQAAGSFRCDDRPVTAAPNPLVATRSDSTRWYTGLSLVESVDDTVAGIESGSWVDSTIGGLATGLDALATVLDPLGALVSWGVAWLLEHVKPLSDALDWLAGDPDQIAAYAQTWRNVAERSASTAEDQQSAVKSLADWAGPAAQAYRDQAAEQIHGMQAIARAAAGLGAVVEGAGLLVALVRELVRDLIADFVATLAVRLPMWTAEVGLTLGIASPLVVSQVGSLVAKWAARIAKLVNALLSSLRRLRPMMSRLDDVITDLADHLGRLARTDPTGQTGSPVDDMGRRSDWTDPADRPQGPSRPPDSYLTAGDPVYYRPGATAIGYDGATMNNFDLVGPLPGHHDVVVHGTRAGAFRPGQVGADGGDYPTNFTHPQQIADAIRSNPHYDGGPVRLVSCHSGTVDPAAGVSPPAQVVADALGVPVVAPTVAVGVDRYAPAGQTPLLQGSGQWVTFYPQGATHD